MKRTRRREERVSGARVLAAQKVRHGPEINPKDITPKIHNGPVLLFPRTLTFHWYSRAFCSTEYLSEIFTQADAPPI